MQINGLRYLDVNVCVCGVCGKCGWVGGGVKWMDSEDGDRDERGSGYVYEYMCVCVCIEDVYYEYICVFMHMNTQ